MSYVKYQKLNTKIDIEHVAILTNLTLTPHEKSIYKDQLSRILGYVKQLESIDTTAIETTFIVRTNNNITRNDKVSKGITHKEALANVANKKNGFIVTGGVFDNE